MNKETEDTLVGGIIFVVVLVGVVFCTLLYQAYQRGIEIKQPPVEPVEMPIYDETATYIFQQVNE